MTGPVSQLRRFGAFSSRSVLFAKATLLVERLAPILVAAGAPIAALVLAGLFGAWASAPRWAHATAIAAAFALAAAIAFRMRRGDLLPSRSEALARLERDGGVRHDALQALEDHVAGAGGPLWDAHRAAMREKAAAARLAAPRMTANTVDPYGARYAALALLAVGFVAAGSNAGGRIVSAFLASDPQAAAAGYADLWIEPPAYTGKAPLYLLRAGDTLPGARPALDAPEGSVVRAQVNARARFRLALKSGRKTFHAERDADNSSRATLTLVDNGVLSLRAGGREGRWPINVIADRAPSIAFVEAPAGDRDGRVAMSATIDDDYGAVSALLRLKLDPDQERPLDAAAFEASAIDAERTLPLDGFAGVGARSVAIDLQSDPWAGLEVEATLIVADAAGQTAETAPAALTLPAKPFFNPLARAVIEQRRSLAVAPNQWRRVEWAFGGMTLGPEYFFDSPTDYLLLRTAMWRVNKEAGGDYERAVADFWPLALQLEDETLELARRRLDATKEALKEALENGAPDGEIERLTEAMRDALQQYLQALAQAGAGAADGPPADEVVSSADLDAMLDSIRDLAKSGAEDAARQALADLEDLLASLRPPRRAEGGSNGEGRTGGRAGEAGDLIGRQRELADKSFERGQQPGEAGDDLGDEQGGIAEDLSELMNALQSDGEGADASGAAGEALAKALGDMRRSEQALRGEDFDAAGDAMERAIANLREGAEKLAQGQQAGAQAGRSRDGVMRDPLGRPIGEAFGQGVDIPEKSDAQKARELLRELRRRLSDGERTEDEIDYLERLLRRF